MKKIIIVFLVIAVNAGMAQRMAFIEMEKIINKMPEYKRANEVIESQILLWESEVADRFENVENLYQEYVKNEMRFSDDIKLQKQEEIFEAEKKAKEFREQKFGKEGELNKLKNQQIQPIQESIFNAASKVASDSNYDYVFDKTPTSNWIYVKEEHNITEKVINELGINTK